ncbi:MAG: hypothetical protein AVDCRST_MAG89-3455, partial [uncultured Gemmatimonadetes bacterium]
ETARLDHPRHRGAARRRGGRLVLRDRRRRPPRDGRTGHRGRRKGAARSHAPSPWRVARARLCAGRGGRGSAAHGRVDRAHAARGRAPGAPAGRQQHLGARLDAARRAERAPLHHLRRMGVALHGGAAGVHGRAGKRVVRARGAALLRTRARHHDRARARAEGVHRPVHGAGAARAHRLRAGRRAVVRVAAGLSPRGRPAHHARAPGLRPADHRGGRGAGGRRDAQPGGVRGAGRHRRREPAEERPRPGRGGPAGDLLSGGGPVHPRGPQSPRRPASLPGQGGGRAGGRGAGGVPPGRGAGFHLGDVRRRPRPHARAGRRPPLAGDGRRRRAPAGAAQRRLSRARAAPEPAPGRGRLPGHGRLPGRLRLRVPGRPLHLRGAGNPLRLEAAAAAAGGRAPRGPRLRRREPDRRGRPRAARHAGPGVRAPAARAGPGRASLPGVGRSEAGAHPRVPGRASTPGAAGPGAAAARSRRRPVRPPRGRRAAAGPHRNAATHRGPVLLFGALPVLARQPHRAGQRNSPPGRRLQHLRKRHPRPRWASRGAKSHAAEHHPADPGPAGLRRAAL